MKYIHDTAEFLQVRESVVVIGKFDGLHLGHRKLLRAAMEDRREGRDVVVFTFSRPPQDLLSGRTQTMLATARERREMAGALGADVLVEYPFTEEVRHMSAERFMADILKGQLRTAEIVAGPDCAFGYQRRGNVAFLREHAREYGCEVRVVEKEIWRGEEISSTRIRESLDAGKPEEAEAMLGYPYSFCSEIVHGRHLGHTLGFPTVNQIIPPDKYLPAFGVYATVAELDGKRLMGISNVGIKPTVSGGNAAGVETFLYDFDGDVYGKTVKVGLKHFVRPERKFASLEALKEQVSKDREKVREMRRCLL